MAGRTRNACLQSRGRGEELLWPSAHCPPGKTHSFLGHPTAVKSQSRLCPPDSLLGSPASAKGCTRQTPAEVTPKGWENSPGVGGSQPRPDSPPLRAPLRYFLLCDLGRLAHPLCAPGPARGGTKPGDVVELGFVARCPAPELLRTATLHCLSLSSCFSFALF